MLMDSGHKVIEADSGAAALDLLPGSDVDVLLVDYAMPGMNGAQTAAAALKLKPGLPVLFVTGYADLEALSQVREEQILKKPYRDEELRQKLDAALAI
jgi:CheY-like chemotaxis protein